MRVTKKEFCDYVDCQMQGLVNMFDVKNVMALTGLSKEKILYIMENYTELEDKYFDNPITEILK